MREGCTVEVARNALDRIVRDEVRHRDFGWALLDWLLQAHGEPMRTLVQRELPRMLARVRANYGQSDFAQRDEHQGEPDAADAAWGLMPTARYAKVLERCIRRDYATRFAGVGIVLDPDADRPRSVPE
jgi:hypothetical protein